MTVSNHGKSYWKGLLARKMLAGLTLGAAVFAGIYMPTPANAQWQVLLAEGALARGLAGAAARAVVATEGRVVAGAVIRGEARAIVNNPRIYYNTFRFAPSIRVPLSASHNSAPSYAPSYAPTQYGGGYQNSYGYSPSYTPRAYTSSRCTTQVQMCPVPGGYVRRTFTTCN